MTITAQEMNSARAAWGDGLIAISYAYETQGIDSARDEAQRILDDLYGYALGPVLFKPTLSGGEKTFRTTKEGALSYFVGHDANYPNDGGFGIKGWRKMTSQTAATFIEGDVALWMGNVSVSDKDANVTTVDKSFGYKKDENGTLRIILHHSSLPYVP